jgi:tRNA pseudouridine13 synthase
MEHQELVESPRKRQKTEAVAATDGAADALPETSAPPVENAQTLKELGVGITEFVTASNEGFSGILKKR